MLLVARLRVRGPDQSAAIKDYRGAGGHSDSEREERR
jgi:hypothetical protein